MKNLSLSMQIWLFFTAIMLSVSIVLSVLFPWTLRDFFTKEIYATIESAQNLALNGFNTDFSRETWESSILSERRQKLQDMRTVNHFILLKDNQEIIASRTSEEFLNKVRSEVKTQKSDTQRYSGLIGERKIFYVITRGKVWNRDAFLVSYMGDTYREDLVKTLLRRLVLIMSVAFILSWMPSFGLARYLSKPLVILEKRVQKLANRDWNESIQLQRRDEIGRLGHSVEQLRKQLLKQDEAQQSFLQQTSHELKTPVMVIRSYTQAIKDGIYPKGNMEKSIQVIEEESIRLEKQIHNLLYLTKLDYLTTHKPSDEQVSIDILIKDVVERFKWRRSELNWELNLNPAVIKGDLEQWRVVLENLLDNQIRYAESRIVIEITISENTDKQQIAHINIWNDGPAIATDIVGTIFDKFHKGPKGEVGLGLAIVQRAVSLNRGKVWVKNEKSGVSFVLEVPLA